MILVIRKPKGYPHKESLEQQEQFIKYYAELKSTLPAEDGIMFMDSCHPSMATKLSYGWIMAIQAHRNDSQPHKN